jgi:hypothetical protein
VNFLLKLMIIGGLKNDKNNYFVTGTAISCKKNTAHRKSSKTRTIMKPPRIPPLVTDLVQTALSSLDGMEFAEISFCPACGGTLQGHDRKKKQFAVLRELTGERVISVRVRRFRCRDCGILCYADEPFYPDTRIGSPVIDIFLSLSAMMPPSRAARVIDAMGIVVHRTTWKKYRGKSYNADIPVVDIFGMRLPVCIVQLSDIAVRSGESGLANPADTIAACGYPSRTSAATRSQSDEE